MLALGSSCRCHPSTLCQGLAAHLGTEKYLAKKFDERRGIDRTMAREARYKLKKKTVAGI